MYIASAAAQVESGRAAALDYLGRGTAAFRAGDVIAATRDWSEAIRLCRLNAAPDLEAQQKLSREMQEEFWQNPSYVPLGMYDQPTGFRSYLQDVRDGWPQFYGVRRL